MPSTTKVDCKRELREFYAPRREPVVVDLPDLAYLMIDGHGDPNTAPEFSQAIEALDTVTYTVKFALKRAPEGIDYGVMPLEGLFWTPDMSTFTTTSPFRISSRRRRSGGLGHRLFGCG